MIQQNLLQMIQAEKVEWKMLGEVAEYIRGLTYNKSNESSDGLGYKVLRANNITLSTNTLNFDDVKLVKFDTKVKDTQKLHRNDILISAASGSREHVGKVAFIATDIDYYFGGFMGVIRCSENINPRFLFHLLTGELFKNYLNEVLNSSTINNLNSRVMSQFLVPIPSLETQQKIVKILDKMTELEATLEATLEAELSQRRRQYEYYRNALLDFDNRGGVIAKLYPDCLKDVVWKTLGEVAENLNFMRRPITSGLREAGNIPYYGASGIVDYVKDYIFDGDFLLISEDGANLLARKTPIAFSISGKSWVNNHAHILKFATYAERRFIEFYLNNIDLTPYISGSAQPKLNKQSLNSIKVPNPPLEIQQKIVAILDQFDTLTQSISQGLPREITLRRRQYEYYRGQLFNFAPAA